MRLRYPGYRQPTGKRSPLSGQPLRVPGQSLDEAIQKVVEDQGEFALTVICALVALTVVEWFRWYYAVPVQPVLVTILAAVGCAAAFLRLRRVRRIVKTLALARDGEREVAEILEEIR